MAYRALRSFSALAFALTACGPGGADPGDGALDAPASDAASDGAEPDAAPFAPAPHAALPQVPWGGGPVLEDLHLVTVTFANDATTPTLQALGDWFFDSGYAVKVAREYGVKAGRQVARVQLAENAPDTITDNQIQQLLARHIADGTLPRPDDGTLYLLYVLDTTRVVTQFGTGCAAFDGYHSESRLSDGTRYSYGLVVPCGSFRRNTTPLEQVEIAASHELIEAATDPRPYSHPGYVLGSDPFATISYGGEVGDLCNEHQWRQDGFAVQRIWSNAAAAAAQGSPCVPVPEGELFLGVSVDEPLDLNVAPGGTVTFTLHAWSNLPSDPWTISVGSHIDGYTEVNALTPPGSVTNGSTVTVTLGVGADAPIGQEAIGYLEPVGPRGRAFDFIRVPVAMLVE